MELSWVMCPHCGAKTRIKLRPDTELRNFPLFCPKCKQEFLIDAIDQRIRMAKCLTQNLEMTNASKRLQR